MWKADGKEGKITSESLHTARRMGERERELEESKGLNRLMRILKKSEQSGQRWTKSAYEEWSNRASVSSNQIALVCKHVRDLSTCIASPVDHLHVRADFPSS